MADSQPPPQTLTDTFQKIQDDLQSTVSALQTLQSQHSESSAVSREFSTVKATNADDTKIYKLIGPVLFRQSHAEATSAVQARLEYISKEMGRTEGRVKELQGEGEKVRGEIIAQQGQGGG